MKITIKDWRDSREIWSGDAENIREAVLAALAAKANLNKANLSKANLSWANLSGANLSGANLNRANLSKANGAELAIAQTRILPAGTLIGWKKCADGVIAKLEIPADAKRTHAFGRKCRAEFVRTLDLSGANTSAPSMRGDGTTYTIGEITRCDKWCDDWQEECAGGIHFFITREEAEAWT